jgi:hypothetical protein
MLPKYIISTSSRLTNWLWQRLQDSQRFWIVCIDQAARVRQLTLQVHDYVEFTF